MKWLSTDYLSEGNIRQQNVYRLLQHSGITQVLAEFSPVITGTIPISIDLKNSDIDIICEVVDCKKFETIVCENFGKMDGFKLEKYRGENYVTITASFIVQGEVFEIYGEPKPVIKQNAFLHMVKEAEILKAKGEEFRQEIIHLKESGMKTEPAFAHLLGLKGNPYEALLHYTI